MDGVDETKGITQLLLSPVLLLRVIQGSVAPGALLLLLLAHKGSPVLRHAWLDSPFGYKTKVAVFLFLAYVVGYVLVLPISFIGACKRYYHHVTAPAGKPESVAPSLPDSPYSMYTEAEMGNHMLTGAVTDGLILSTPGLMDRLSLVHSDAAFHLGTGCALLIASLFPGDNMRLLEAVAGFMMLCVGIQKAGTLTKTYLQSIGIGLVAQFASLTPQQIQVWAAMVKGLKNAGQAPQEQPHTPKEQPSVEQR